MGRTFHLPLLSSGATLTWVGVDIIVAILIANKLIINTSIMVHHPDGLPPLTGWTDVSDGTRSGAELEEHPYPIDVR